MVCVLLDRFSFAVYMDESRISSVACMFTFTPNTSIGESLQEYEQNLAGPVCAVQLKKGLAGVSKEDMKRVAIA